MAIKLYEGDKEVKFMTLSEVAKQLNTTVAEIKKLAKETYLPIYDIAGGRVSSGDLDFIKEKLNGNLDIEFTGCAVQLGDDGTGSIEEDEDKVVFFDWKKEMPTFDDLVKGLKTYNENESKYHKKYGDTYWDFIGSATSYLEKEGLLDCTEAGCVIGGTDGEIGLESRWILEKVEGNKYYFVWYSDWDPDVIPTQAYACMPKGQKDIDQLRLIDLKIEDVDIDQVDGCYDKIFRATYIKDKEEGKRIIPMRNIYKRYINHYSWNDKESIN